jgi:DNA gyrase subunit B
MVSFANNIKTIEGGTHLDGFKTSITKAINSIGKDVGKLKGINTRLSGEFVREGLVGVISVQLPEPEFEGQVKSKLGNPDVKNVVEEVLIDQIKEFFLFIDRSALDKILEKSISAYNAALAAKKAREMIRRKSALEYNTLPGKLADCSIKDPKKTEIFIVEGDSAGGSAKQARNRFFQAILPLRGKIINIEKRDDTRMYKNSEIQALISAIGLSTQREDMSLNRLRYRRIIIMTDADVDGAHIRTLLLTFFYRYQRKLIESGIVYIACPPLYKIEPVGKSSQTEIIYCYSESELEYYLNQGDKKFTVQRFKGLGEMMPQQLWETTMDPGCRIIKRVDVFDADKADKIFNVLMGEKVFARKEFIQMHADKIKSDRIDI